MNNWLINCKLTIYFNYSYYIESKTLVLGATKPDVPDFSWENQPTDNGYAKIKINWKPKTDGNPGSHFYVQHREVGESKYLESPPQINEDFVEIGSLNPDKKYEVRVVSVDGDFNQESLPRIVDPTGGSKFNVKKMNVHSN